MYWLHVLGLHKEKWPSKTNTSYLCSFFFFLCFRLLGENIEWSFNVWLQLKKYYQPRKSRRTLSLILHGEKVPLYGAGAGLALSSAGGAVPLTLDLEIISRGYVIGKLVKVKHRKHVSCPLVVDSSNTKPIRFSQNACSYEWLLDLMLGYLVTCNREHNVFHFHVSECDLVCDRSSSGIWLRVC